MEALQTNVSLPHRVLRGTASNYVGQAVALTTGVVLTPFILRNVGAQHFGLWALAAAVVSYGAVLDLGISAAVVKYVAEHRARGEAEEAHRLVATALGLYTFLGLVAFALSGLVAAILPHLLHFSPANRQLIAWLIMLSGFGLGVSLPCGTAIGVLRGVQRFGVVNLLAVARTLLTAIGTVVVLLLGGGVIGLVAIEVAATLVMQVPAVWFVHRVAPDLNFGWRGGSLGLARRVLAFSLSVGGIQFAGLLTKRVDPIVVGSALPVSAVTPYVLAQRLAQMVELLTKQFLAVILPLASEIHARNDLESLRKLYLSATRLTLAASLPVAVVLGALSPRILSVWVGEEYAKYSYLVVILAVNGVADTMLWPGQTVLIAMERHRPFAWMAIGKGLANLVLSIVLVRRFGLGGVAFGTLIPTVAVALLFFLPYVTRTIGVSLTQIVKEVCLPVAIPVIALAAILAVARQAAEQTALGGLIAIVFASTAIYASIYVAVGASKAERAFYRRLTVNASRVVSMPFRRS